VKRLFKIIILILSLSCYNIIADTNGYYKIKSGDSLYKISKIFWGQGVKWTNLYKLNYDKIKNPNLIYPQQQIIVKGFYYTVKKGDSLYCIAKKLYGSSKYWHQIYRINSDIIDNPELIFPEQNILLPEIESDRSTVKKIAALTNTKTSNKLTIITETNIPPKNNMTNTNIVTSAISNNIKAETNKAKMLKGVSTTNLLLHIPFSKKYNTHRLILNHRNKKNNIDDFLPPQLKPDDFTNVQSLAAGEFHNKNFKDNIVYITVCDFGTALEKESFWKVLKEKITNSTEFNSKITTFHTNNSEGFKFEVAPQQYTFLKDESPNLITIVKTEIKYQQEIATFSRLFSNHKSVLEDEKVNNEIFILPSTLPFGLKFQEFYLEKIPPEYVSEKTKAKWAKKMVGKMNITAIYLDKENTQWTINLFNLENEQEAKTIYDNLYSKPKQEIMDKLEKNPNSKESERLKSILEITGEFEPIYVGKYKGWFIQNRLENIEEINFRTSYYLITISVSKQRQKENLIKLANTLQIDKILKSNQITSPKH